MALDVGFQNRNHDLSIKRFGSFHLVANGDHIVKWRTKKAKELFAYLWINSEVSVNRDTLISKLFPNINEKKANTLLSTTLYQMRQVLQEYTNEEVIKYLNNGYRFKLKIPSDYDVVLNIIESNEFTEENYRILRKLLKGEFLEEENYAWSDRIATQTILSTKHYLKAYLNNIECDNLLIEDILLFMFDLDAKDETVIGNILSFYKENESYSKYADFSTKCLKLKGNGILKPQVSNTAL